MDATKVQNQILREHLLRDIDKRHIRANGVAMVVGIPVLIGFTHHTGTVAVERILHVDVNRFTETLQLPATWHGDLVPIAHIIILAIEVGRARIRVLAPMELPLPVETHNLFALLPFRRQLQCGVIRQFVETKYMRVLPVVRRLRLCCNGQQQ